MTAKEILEPFIDVSALKDTDKILSQATNTDTNSGEANTAVRLTAALFRAYITKNLIGVTDDGYIVVDGKVTESNINTPQFRKGSTGIDVSTDNGKTWDTIALYSDLMYRQPVVMQTGKTATIYPNVLNVWGEVSSLDISLGAGNSGEVNEYMLQFTCGNTAATITLPKEVRWAEEPAFELNRTYQISILNNLAVYASWENSTEE